MTEVVRNIGIALVALVIVVIIIGALYFLWNKLKEKGFGCNEGAEINAAYNTEDGFLRISILIGDKETKYKYDVAKKKITVKGKNDKDIKLIQDTEGHFYFVIRDEEEVYTIKGKEFVTVFDPDIKDDIDDGDDGYEEV
ncbi:MAG: hypothetical protein E7311_07550 [Clostridiales bacterium]|nr:hypothetical protein [Clostridiales bacterium]